MATAVKLLEFKYFVIEHRFKKGGMVMTGWKQDTCYTSLNRC